MVNIFYMLHKEHKKKKKKKTSKFSKEEFIWEGGGGEGVFQSQNGKYDLVVIFCRNFSSATWASLNDNLLRTRKYTQGQAE